MACEIKFAHRFAGGPPVPKPPPQGTPARVRHEWREFGRAALAWAVSCATLGLMILALGPGTDTTALSGWIARLSVVLAVWFVGWPVWETVRTVARPQPASPRGRVRVKVSKGTGSAADES